MDASEHVQPISRTNAIRAILWGGLIAGILDGADAVVFLANMRGVSTARLFQFIASGLLGKSAFLGGWTTVAVGVACHFVIATGAAAVYYAMTLRWPSLLRRPVLFGPVFGLGAFFFMHYVVVPLSRVPRQSAISSGTYVNLVLSHVLFVGLPIALVASRLARQSAASARRTDGRFATHEGHPA